MYFFFKCPAFLAALCLDSENHCLVNFQDFQAMFVLKKTSCFHYNVIDLFPPELFCAFKLVIFHSKSVQKDVTALNCFL